MSGEFAGKVVLLTGAASGLGQAASIRFAAEGAVVFIVDVNADGLAETRRRIEADGGVAGALVQDLSSQAACAAAVQAAVDAFGRLDVLCNIAGILKFHGLPDITEQDWSRMLAVNLSAPLFMMQAAMPHLIESHGNVVNVASTAAFVGQAYTAPYTATKAGLFALTRSLAMEHIKAPVRINALAPGGMTTPMGLTVQFPETADMALIMRYCGIRPPSAVEEIVEPLLFLASDRAKSVHGTCYLADNDITAG